MKVEDPLVEMEDFQERKARVFLSERVKVQRLIMTEKIFIFIFLPVGLVCFVAGIVMMFVTDDANEVKREYGEECKNKTFCELNITIEKRMDFPIALLYELTGYYANHLSVYKSRNNDQLLGKFVENDDLSNCKPYATDAEGKTIIPSGLQAVSYFNDDIKIPQLGEISLKKQQKTGIEVTKFSEEYKDQAWLDNNRMDSFSIWMETPAFEGFRRMIGVTKTTGYLEKGTVLSVTITNNYDVSLFNGKKSLIITTKGSHVTSSKYLGPLFITLGLIIIITNVLIFVSNPKMIFGM